MRRSIDFLLYLCLGALSSATVLAAFGRYDWRLDLLAHWRLHYTIAAILVAGLLLLRHRYAFTAFAALIVGINGLVVLNTTVEAASPEYPSGQAAGERLRLANVNVQYSNSSYAPALRWLESVEPDVAVIVELTSAWEKAVTALNARLPYAVRVPRNDGDGLAIYSRHAIERSEVLHLGRSRRVAIAAGLAVTGRKITIVAAHPLPPRNRWHTQERDRYLRELASFIDGIQGQEPVILVGDLNTTPWSYAFKDIARSFSAAPSFPATWPAIFGPFGIPIDHVLARGVAIESLRTGSYIGSDHLPLIIETRVPVTSISADEPSSTSTREH